ncbi:hypothetical protein V2O64_05935 [Verrucomicrobiaceae bacterium 227]
MTPRRLAHLCLAAFVATLPSCTFHLKDLFYGDPTKRPVKENYLEAKSEGLSEQSARRRALLIGNDTDETREIKAQRKAKEDRIRDEDDNHFGPLLLWD